MTRIILLLVGMIAWNMTFGQAIDQKKMDKDLEVAKNVLGSMMDKSRGMRFFPRTNDIDAKYVTGQGVTFTVDNRFASLGNGQYALAYTEGVRASKGSRVVIGTAKKEKREAADAPEAIHETLCRLALL